MEQLKRLKFERKLARSAFTKIANILEAAILNKEPVNSLSGRYAIAKSKAEQLFNLDERIKAELLTQCADEEQLEEIEVECEIADEYLLRWENIKEKVERVQNLHTSTRQEEDIYTASTVIEKSHKSNSTRSHTRCDSFKCQKNHLRLPKLELRKFNGELKGWITFWGQFQQIDEDESIEDSDKFQYLIQATEEGSPARRVVGSFPPFGANYRKAIESLKERFAREDLLIEIYVRELLNLVSNRNKNQIKLGELYDQVMTQIKALETLGVTVNKYAAMLFPLVESAIPEDTLRAWERAHIQSESTSNLDHLLKFLKKEVQIEERMNITQTGLAKEVAQTRQPTASCLAAAVAPAMENKGFVKSAAPAYNSKADKQTIPCVWCDKMGHSSVECFKATRMSLEQKKQVMDTKKRCHYCFKSRHGNCRYRFAIRCMCCGGQHQTLFCNRLATATNDNEQQKENQTSSKNLATNAIQAATEIQHHTTLLQTLAVKISNGETSQVVRAFVDSGAQRSYILRHVASSLNLEPIRKQLLGHCLFGGVETEKEEHDVHEFIVENINSTYNFNMTALQKNVITGTIPRLSCSHEMVTKLKQLNIELSDYGPGAPEIGLLIGSDYLGALITRDVVHLNENIVALRTKLGWTIQGPVNNSSCYVSSNVIQANLSITELWDLETLGINDPVKTVSRAETAAQVIEDFKATVSVNYEGRYEVSLPWKTKDAELQSNRNLAVARLHSTTKKLVHMNEVEAYDRAFREWQELDIIEVSADEKDKGHYLSHHAVIKETSLTTRVRPVFNASAKDKNGVSLNELLDKGLNYLELIPKLLLKFREHAVGIISDIKKAFLQISIKPEDRIYLKFLWWKDKEMKEIIVYRHRRVVFGLTSSPFLLAATIVHHLEKYSHPEHPLRKTARRLLESFYVDNCVTSIETEAESREFIEEAKILMLEGKFELRGWVTAPIKNQEMTDNDKELSVLGMMWNTENDTLRCRIDSIEITEHLTQRQLMSVAQKVFDPIGITCPTTLIPKLLLQKSHRAHCKLDAPLPEEIVDVYTKWLKEVHELKDCIIPRRLTKASVMESTNSIHVFCDASGSAYATCIFLRSEFHGQVTVELITAKSRVAPMEEITIPRLELLEALIASRLYAQVVESLEQKCEVYFWTDSTVVLTWITTNGNWGVWVKNRVKEIRLLTSVEKWCHLPGSLNPADLPSRSCYPKALKESKWWEGPNWLRSDREEWPKSTLVITKPIAVGEKMKTEEELAVTSSDLVDDNAVLQGVIYFSKYPMMIRMVAWIIRFLHNCRNQNARDTGDIKFEEYEKAEKILLKLVQQQSRKRKSPDLQTFKDEEGLIRVRTKLLLTEETQTFKTPILLHNNHVVVQRLVEHTHRLLKHAGPGTMITQLREYYWIVKVRRLIKSVIRRCLICKKDKSKSIHLPESINLPRGRTNPKAVFEVTGIDLAGPLYLRSGEKVWIVLFTCAVYRAIHLELTYALSTEAFIMSLRRFIARRGRPRVIYTDNATNFHGTENQLKELDWQNITALCNVQKIKWIFNVPAAPWWGGFFERMIRSTKDLLRRNLGNSILDYEELYTLICDCESLINSRPLTYVADDVLRPLTPDLFLKSLENSGVEDIDHIDHETLNIRLKYVQQLRQDLRQRFRSEYLALLVLREPSTTADKDIKVGEVVLVETPEKRIHWPIGVIQELKEGRDGITRVAKVKTRNGILERPLQRLHRLEITPDVADHGPLTADKDIKVGEVVLVETPEKRIHWPIGVIQELKEGRDGITRVAKVKTRNGILERPLQRLHRLEITPDVADHGPLTADQPTARAVTRSGRQIRRPLRFRE